MAGFSISTLGWKVWGLGMIAAGWLAVTPPLLAQQPAPSPTPVGEGQGGLASPPRLVDGGTPTASAPPGSGPAPAGPPTEMPTAPPPLSLADAIDSLRAGVDLIERPSGLSPQQKSQRVEYILGSVIRYVERIDRQRPTLPYYHWERVSADKVDRTNPEPRKIILQDPVPGVTAIAFKASNSDIELRKVITTDIKGARWEFNTPILLAADQPRLEVCYLPLQTELKSIEVVLRRLEPKERDPRLLVDIGVCEIEESAKEALYYMQLTRDDLKLDKPQDAAQHLRRAIKCLESYKASRRL